MSVQKTIDFFYFYYSTYRLLYGVSVSSFHVRLPYSPDLAPVDFFYSPSSSPSPFPLKGRKFDTIQEMKQKIAGGTVEDFERCIFCMLPAMKAPLGKVCD